LTLDFSRKRSLATKQKEILNLGDKLSKIFQASWIKPALILLIKIDSDTPLETERLNNVQAFGCPLYNH